MKRLLAVLVPVLLLVGCAAHRSTAYEDGIRFYREGQYAAAREAFESAVRQEPQFAAAWNNRGVARARLGDLGGAVQDYTHAMALAPNDAEIAFNRGNAYAAAGNLSAAAVDFTTATSLRPGYAQAFFNRGAVRAAAGDYAGALKDWQWAIDVESDPWTKSAMRRGSGIDHASAALVSAVPMPRDVQGGGVVVSTTASGGVVTSPTAPPPAVIVPAPGAPPVAVAPPAPAPPMSSTALDVRALVARAMSREVDGDRPGAVADLRAALMAEQDPARRARIDRLLRILEASR